MKTAFLILASFVPVLVVSLPAGAPNARPKLERVYERLQCPLRQTVCRLHPEMA